jgi:hypothetical protein
MGFFSFLFGRGNGRDGSSPDKAIVAASVAAEYDWLAKNYPGFTPMRQSLQDIEGKPYDVIVLRLAPGEEKTLYFDISSFYGKM